MTRRVFYSFHYDFDAWRASQVRGIGVVEGNTPTTPNQWEQVWRRGDASIKRWIDDQMSGRSCVIVLVGAETAYRPWIQYEIKKAWIEGKGILGIRIHRLLDARQQPSIKGPNPFDLIVFDDGELMSSMVSLYDPPYTNSKDVYAYISNNIEYWIEEALASD